MKRSLGLLVVCPVWMLACASSNDAGDGGSGARSSDSTSDSTSTTSTTTVTSTTTSSSSSGSSTSGGMVCTPNAVESCYSGPSGTEGVGTCVAGTRTCNAEGTGTTDCTGEVLPTTEDCATPADEDCDGATPACASWVTTFVGPTTQFGEVIAVRPTGGVVVAGGFEDHLDWGSGSADSLGDDDVFIAALDDAGHIEWVKTFGSTANDYALGLAIDGTGRIALSARYSGAGLIDGAPVPDGDMLIATFEPDGTVSHVKTYYGADLLTNPGFDASGDLVMSGRMTAPFDWGAGTQGDDGSVVVLKLHSDLSYVSSTIAVDQVGFPSLSDFSSVTLPSGAVAMTGGIDQSVDLGSGPITLHGETDVFIRLIDPNGVSAWGSAAGSVNLDVGGAIVLDGSTGLVTAGSMGGSIDFGGATSPLTGYNYITHFDASGQATWASAFASTYAVDDITGLTRSSTGHYFVAGVGYGILTFGSSTVDLGSPGPQNTFLGEVDASGTLVNAQALTSGPAYGAITGLAAGPGGEIYIVGGFQAVLNGPSGPISSTGGYDAFVYKMTP